MGKKSRTKAVNRDKRDIGLDILDDEYKELNSRFPNFHEMMTDIMSGHGLDPEWLLYSARTVLSLYIPESEEIFLNSMTDPVGSVQSTIYDMMSSFPQYFAWRYAQSIYTFNKDLIEYLKSTMGNNSLPSEVFSSLPVPCPFIHTPNLIHIDRHNNPYIVKGFLVRYYEVGNHRCLHFSVFHSNGSRKGVRQIPLGTNGTINDFRVIDERRFKGGKRNPIVDHLLNITLYLCAKNAEIRPRLIPIQSLDSKSVISLKRVHSPKIWEVGYRIGAKLQSSPFLHIGASEPTDRTVSPHVRRAHWHLHRVGHGREGLVLRWHLPTFVGGRDIIPTGHGVE